MPKYEDLILEKWYNVVTTSFLLNGGDNHTDIQHGYRNQRIGPLDVDYLVDFFRKKSPIIYGTEGRQTFLGQWKKSHL